MNEILVLSVLCALGDNNFSVFIISICISILYTEY